MSIWISGVADSVVVHVAGDLTIANRRDLQQLALDAVERGERHLFVDLGATGYVDSAGLGTLVLVAKRVAAAGGALAVVEASDDVRTLLELTKLDGVIGLEPAQRAA